MQTMTDADARLALGALLQVVEPSVVQQVCDHVATTVGVSLVDEGVWDGLVAEATERKIQLDAEIGIEELEAELGQKGKPE